MVQCDGAKLIAISVWIPRFKCAKKEKKEVVRLTSRLATAA